MQSITPHEDTENEPLSPGTHTYDTPEALYKALAAEFKVKIDAVRRGVQHTFTGSAEPILGVSVVKRDFNDFKEASERGPFIIECKLSTVNPGERFFFVYISERKKARVHGVVPGYREKRSADGSIMIEECDTLRMQSLIGGPRNTRNLPVRTDRDRNRGVTLPPVRVPKHVLQGK